MMNISYKSAGDVTIARIAGSLDTASSVEAEASLCEAIDSGAAKLLIDLGKLDFISSAGLRVLLGIARRLGKQQGLLRLANLNDTVTEVFAISGFDSIIETCPSIADALQGMSQTDIT